MDTSDVIGLVSGLLAIFTFLTGITSIRDLAQVRTGSSSPANRAHQTRSRLVLALSIPVFAVSMVITLTQGLAGSDTGGAQFLLLAAGAILLLVYAVSLRHRWHWAAFFVTSVVVLGVLGFVMGTVSRGEEAESMLAGLAIGAGVGLVALALPRNPAPHGTSPPLGPARPDAPPTSNERHILAYARELGGDVTVAAVALNTPLTLDQAHYTLENLAAAGYCQRWTVPDGAVIFRFPDLRTR